MADPPSLMRMRTAFHVAPDVAPKMVTLIYAIDTYEFQNAGMFKGHKGMNDQFQKVTVNLEILPIGRRERLKLASNMTVLQAVQRCIDLPEHVVRCGVRELLASSDGSKPTAVNQNDRIGDLRSECNSANDNAVKLIVRGRTSPFGSHWSMACDEFIQVICLGWPRYKSEIILKDDRGTYVTSRSRLDNRLADPNRYCDREHHHGTPS